MYKQFENSRPHATHHEVHSLQPVAGVHERGGELPVGVALGELGRVEVHKDIDVLACLGVNLRRVPPVVGVEVGLELRGRGMSWVRLM